MKVEFVKVLKMINGKYPNEIVDRDTILYCHKYEDCEADRACNRIMRQSIHPKSPFRVLLIVGRQSYDWGVGIVEDDDNMIHYRGFDFDRFKIKRVAPVEPSSRKTPPRRIHGGRHNQVHKQVHKVCQRLVRFEARGKACTLSVHSQLHIRAGTDHKEQHPRARGFRRRYHIRIRSIYGSTS